MFPPLSNDSQSDRRAETEARKLPGTDQDRTIKAAIDDFRRILSADGTLHGDEDRLDLIRVQLDSLALEAERSGYLHQDPIRLRIGGVEHDVISVFDLRPANVFVTDDGIVVPIDCIPVRLPRGKHAFFDK
jgi:hypothetical protein